jgi:hypothetical protein
MLRRALSVAAIAAAALAAVPGTASAATTLRTATLSIYYASTQVTLGDGRQVEVDVTEDRGGQDKAWSQQVTVRIGNATGITNLTGSSRVRFASDLSSASATNVPVTLQTGSYVPGSGWVTTSQKTTVSVTFTGKGSITRTTHHYTNFCSVSGDPGCTSTVKDSSRKATATVHLGRQTGSGAGTLTFEWNYNVFH